MADGDTVEEIAIYDYESVSFRSQLYQRFLPVGNYIFHNG